jgi:hypothetical protein
MEFLDKFRLWQLSAMGRSPVRRDSWLHARLIPTYGIRSQDEQEKRATSCLLAVMHGVPEFGHALLRELGAPKSPSIDTFAEVRFKNADGKVDIPDGAIVCQRGAKRWTCLVEVKTGAAMLKDEQVDRTCRTVPCPRSEAGPSGLSAGLRGSATGEGRERRELAVKPTPGPCCVLDRARSAKGLSRKGCVVQR